MSLFSRRMPSQPCNFRQLLFASAATVATAGSLYLARDRLIRPLAAEEPKLKHSFGSLGFKSLKLDSVERLNHDTRRLRFVLPDGENAVSGLQLTGALLSMSWPTGRWSPAFRPYTPVSRLGG